MPVYVSASRNIMDFNWFENYMHVLFVMILFVITCSSFLFYFCYQFVFEDESISKDVFMMQ